jgi:hypothetical protein
MATEYVGANMYFAWVYSGGTVTLHADERTVSLNPSVDFAESTAGSDARKTRIATVKDFAVSFAGVAQTGGTVLEDALAEGTRGTILFGPEGTVLGTRKHVIGAHSQGAKFALKYADVTEITCDFMGDGNYSRTTWP